MEVDYADKIRELSRFASAAAAVARRTVNIRYQDLYANGATVSGVTPGYSETNTIDLDDGRFFTGEDDDAGRRVAVIGASVEEALFPQGNALGKSIRLGGQKF